MYRVRLFRFTSLYVSHSLSLTLSLCYVHPFQQITINTFAYNQLHKRTHQTRQCKSTHATNNVIFHISKMVKMSDIFTHAVDEDPLQRVEMAVAKKPLTPVPQSARFKPEPHSATGPYQKVGVVIHSQSPRALLVDSKHVSNNDKKPTSRV